MPCVVFGDLYVKGPLGVGVVGLFSVVLRRVGPGAIVITCSMLSAPHTLKGNGSIVFVLLWPHSHAGHTHCHAAAVLSTSSQP